jgi:hypothetical protein
MLRPYDYLFYKIYSLMKKGIPVINSNIKGHSFAAAFRAAIVVIAFVDVPIIMGLIKIVYLYNLFILEVPKNFSLKLVLALCVIHYFVFFLKNRFLKIEERFKNENSRQNILGFVIVSAFVTFCWIFLFFILIIPKVT